MKNPDYSSHPFEPTKDELPTETAVHFAIDRRKFLKLTGGGLIVAFVFHDLASFKGESVSTEAGGVPASGVGAWLHIGEDGKVTVYTGKVEVGQNIRTSLSQIVAEELMFRMPVSTFKSLLFAISAIQLIHVVNT